jgi:Family of unknown function (DUF6152)
MARKSLFFVAFAVALLPLSSPLFAHHGSAAFETATPVTVKGSVTLWTWANPHCFLKFDAKDEAGTVVHWAVEVSNPADMVKRGWTDHSFKPGDEVTVTLLRAKNGNSVGRLQKVVLPNGQTLVGMEGTGAFPPADNSKSQNNQEQ